MTLESRINKALSTIKRPQMRKALRKGIKEELEHSSTIRWIKKHPQATVVEGAKRIAQDHTRKDPDYYTKHEGIEPKRQKGPRLNPPRVKLIGRRGKVKIYRVDDTKARRIFPDWTMGGHDVTYDFVPRNEVWIAGELGPPRPPLEENLTMLHELRERRRMSELIRSGMSKSDAYEQAHNESLEVEDYYRKRNGRGLKQALGKERGQ